MKTRTFLSQLKSSNFLNIFMVFGLIFCNITSVIAQSNEPVLNNTAVLFIDKTLSSKPDSFIEEKNNFWIKKIVKENIKEAGDKISVSFIFKNTTSFTNKYEFIYNPPKPKVGRMSSSEERIAKVKYNNRLRAYKKSFTNKVLAKVFSIKPTLTGTDVVGSIKLLSNISVQNTGHIINAFYFSDMQECSSFRHLYCGDKNSKVNSFSHAEILAKQDIKGLLRNYKLPDNCLNNIKSISVIFPARELEENPAFSILPEYWNLIFHELGVQQTYYY